MPVTNAVSKRSLSAMCRLSTYLGTNMGLNLDQHSWTDVAFGFLHGRGHRKTLSGTFDAADLRRNNVNLKL